MLARDGDGVSIESAIAAFVLDMQGRACKPSSIARFETTLRSAAKIAGWTWIDQLTTQALTDFLQERRRTTWSKGSYDAAKSVFGCFCRYALRRGWLKSNPVDEVPRTRGAAGDGARACHEREARAFVRFLLVSSMQKGSGFRNDRAAEQALVMFKVGLRDAEARGIAWKDLHLDAAVPFLKTDPDWDKSGRSHRVPLNAEVVARLRLLRDRAGAVGKVFPHPISRSHWMEVMAKVTTYYDAEGRPASTHAGRQSFSAWIDATGATAGVRSSLMRHADTLAERHYNKISSDAQLSAIAGLPDLWPESIEKKCLTCGDGPIQPASPDSVSPQQSPSRASPPSGSGDSLGEGRDTDPAAQSPGRSVEPTRLQTTGMPISEAALLIEMARVVEEASTLLQRTTRLLAALAQGAANGVQSPVVRNQPNIGPATQPPARSAH